MSVPNQKSQLDPDEAQSQTACTSIVYDSKDLSLSVDAMSIPNPNSLLDPDEACCSSSSTGTISVSKELSFSEEKLEDVQDTDKSKCSELQTHFSDQHFGGACPKKYSKDMVANQGVTKEKLECSEDINESKCSEMQMDSPKQHLGACSKDFHKDSVGQAISDQCDVPKKYYAVSFPSEDFIIKDDPLIFEKKEDAIKAIKQNPEARFREFNTKREALEYASIPYESRVSSSLPEENQKFKILKKRKLVKFGKCLENGNIKHFLRLVWSNPRYLINENGYPTVIKEEAEWNALHIAAISGQIEIFLEILHVLQDIQFMAILHPKEEISKIQAHIRYLVGFYLNTREKVFSGTPLCLACRFGHSGFLSVILPHSESLLKNQLDKNIICQSHNCSTGHKRSMLNLFTEMYYIPVLQDEMCKYVDNFCDAQTVLAAVTTHPLKAGTAAIYCAFVGPAPFLIAKEIYHHLKKKKYTFLKTPLNIVLAPYQKHIEKAGRKLAKQYNIGWIEYWRSLDAWLDISSSNGLQFLENHLSKLNDQVDSLPNERPLFFDMIKNFVEEFLDKISELTITYNKLCLFNELQTLVLFMDCFISYSFSNDTKLFDIHEELGHILFLKLTDDNHRNLENFQMLKLLLISQFSYVTCYQKSMWKMFCCILRFASYFQQDCEFVIKPVCFCDFAIVEDLYDYSSKSCYFKLLSWRQDITNELVQKYEAMVENPLSEETESIPLSFDEEKEDLATNISMLELKDNTSYAEYQVPIYKKYFLQSTTFVFSYCTLIVNGYGTLENFMENFQDVMESWKPICKLNYQQDNHLISIHYEMAFCLFVQFYRIPAEIVQWSRIHLKREISSIASTSQEWTHLVCVTNLFLSMLDGNVSDTPCECHYNTDTAMESVHPLKCVMVLHGLRKRLMSFKVLNPELQKKYNLVQSKEEDRRKKEEEYVTPPDSLSGMKSIYVERGIFSDEDINIYHALLEARVDISKYENIKKWKNLVKHTLAQLQE